MLWVCPVVSTGPTEGPDPGIRYIITKVYLVRKLLTGCRYGILIYYWLTPFIIVPVGCVGRKPKKPSGELTAKAKHFIQQFLNFRRFLYCMRTRLKSFNPPSQINCSLKFWNALDTGPKFKILSHLPVHVLITTSE